MGGKKDFLDAGQGLCPRRVEAKSRLVVSGVVLNARVGKGGVSGRSVAGGSGIVLRSGISTPPLSLRLLRLDLAGQMGRGNLATRGPWTPGPGKRASLKRAGGVVSSNPGKGFSVFFNRTVLGRLAGHLEK